MSQDLYDLPAGWEWKRLGELFEIARGGSPRPIKDFITTDDNGINWIKIGDTEVGGRYIYSTEEKIKPEGLKKSRLVVEGDFILSNSMSFGRPYIMKTKGCIHDGWLLLHPVYGQLDKEFVYYVLSSPYVYKQFQNSAAGATVKNLNSDLVRQVKIPLPPLAEQTRIVEKLDAVLSRIDTAIDELQQSLVLVDAMFKSGLDGVMSDAINEVGLACVNDFLISIQTGTTPPTKDKQYFENGDVDWFAPSDFGENAILSNAIKKINQLALTDGKARSFSAGTIMLVAIGATIGKVGLLEAQACSNQQVTGMLFDEHVKPKFAYYWFLYNKPQVIANASKATLPIINQKGIKELDFCCPSQDKQLAIINLLDALNEQTTQLKTEITAKIGMFNQLKASVLDGAFRGLLI